MFSDKQKDWIWIKSLQLPIGQERKLLQSIASIEEIFDCARRGDARLDVLNDQSRRVIIKKAHIEERERAASALKHHHIRVLLRDEANYPALLHHVMYPPEILYYRGDLQTLQKPMLGMVGMRKPSAYGQAMAHHFAEEIALRDIGIVSGMARGIDGCAHRGALASKKEHVTVAILAAGLDVVYPPEHGELFRSIEENGLLLSENPPGYAVHRYSAPQRNRLIAGLANVLLVVEAEYKSGSRYTVDASLACGREVFAIPGRIDEAGSQLPNYLIQLGANVALEPKDILDAFERSCAFSVPKKKKTHETKKPEPMKKEAKADQALKNKTLSNKEKMIMETLEKAPMTVDRLCMELNWPIHELLVYLTKLEQINMIQKDAANHTFQICISSYG